jgi:hypothetical protein
MSLFAFGCSLTYGQSLLDCTGQDVYTPGPNPSDHAWPSELANIVNISCINLSLPGISNKYILKQILNAPITEDDTVVVQWSYFSRWTVFKDDGNHLHIGPWKNDSFKIFLDNYYSEDDCVFNNVLVIDHAWLHLEKIGCNFIFACAEKNNEKYWNEEDKIKHLFDEKHFKHSNKFHLSIKDFMIDKALDNRHPGPDSHKSYAKYLSNLPIFSQLTNTK